MSEITRSPKDNPAHRSMIKRELKKIQSAEGRLTPDGVIEAARPPSHPLHNQFTWDNTIAGHKWRQAEARQLIRSIEFKVVVNHIVIEAPIYVRDPSVAPEEQGYREVQILSQNRVDSKLAAIREIQQAAGHLARARDISNVLGFAGEFEQLLEELTRMENRIRTAVEPNGPGGPGKSKAKPGGKPPRGPQPSAQV